MRAHVRPLTRSNTLLALAGFLTVAPLLLAAILGGGHG